MKTFTKIFIELARVILGVTFIFSGFVKSVDPYGTAYKVADYLTAFNLSFLSFLEMPISFLLCGFELALGIIVLLGLFPKWSSRLMLATMCFMTPLTLYLAIANPVSDCGCFGDAIVLSNWDTFYKNIVLSFFAVFLALKYQYISPFYTHKIQKYALAFSIVFSILFLCYNYIYDPIIDFRPYKVGVNIPQQMVVSEDKLPVTENIFVYEKDGVRKEFTEDNYPWQDSTWVFVNMDTKVIKEGELPPISDFSMSKIIFNEDNSEVINQYEITQDVLLDKNYSFFIIAPFLQKVEDREKAKFDAIADYAEQNQYSIYLLTSSTTEDIITARQSYNENIKFCVSDEKMLKTIIRSNPSLMLLKNGNIIEKWAKISIPSQNEFNKTIEQIVADNRTNTKNSLKILMVVLLLSVPILLMKGIDLTTSKNNKFRQL